MASPRNPLFAAQATPIDANVCYTASMCLLLGESVMLPVLAVAPRRTAVIKSPSGDIVDLAIDSMVKGGFVRMNTMVEGTNAFAPHHVAVLGTRTGVVRDELSGSVLAGGFATTHEPWLEAIRAGVTPDRANMLVVMWLLTTTLAGPEKWGSELTRCMEQGYAHGAMVPVRWTPLPDPQA